MQMPENHQCTGPREPAWMATKESIDAVAAVYRQRVPAYMDRTGHCVLGGWLKGVLICVEDRSTGVVFRRFDKKQIPGEIIKTNWECVVNGQPNHTWPSTVRILRRARITKVRAMARHGVGIKPDLGFWYEVHTD